MTTFTSKTCKAAIINWPYLFVFSTFLFKKVKSLIVLPLMLLHFDPHYREGIQMLVLYKQINPGKAAAQQLFYYIRPPLDRMLLGEGIQMLFLCNKFRPGKAAAQLLFYYIRPHWTRC